MAKRYKFTVQGIFPFPTDMLRYDSCYPRDTDSAIEMASSFSVGDCEMRNVTLISTNKPTVGRWESFGWRVIKEDRI